MICYTMKGFVSVKSLLFFKKFTLCCLLFQKAYGYPTARSDSTMESEEKQFPNGTVVGKYAYVDKEGNPIQIKYYADDTSYGVELNSLKVMQKEEAENPQNKNSNRANIPSRKAPQDIPKDGTFDIVDTFKYPAVPSGNKFNEQKLEFAEHKEYPRVENFYQKNKYKSPDFEIYAKDDEPQQCGSDNKQAHVYNFVKEARKVREVPDVEENEQFCMFK